MAVNDDRAAELRPWASAGPGRAGSNRSGRAGPSGAEASVTRVRAMFLAPVFVLSSHKDRAPPTFFYQAPRPQPGCHFSAPGDPRRPGAPARPDHDNTQPWRRPVRAAPTPGGGRRGVPDGRPRPDGPRPLRSASRHPPLERRSPGVGSLAVLAPREGDGGLISALSMTRPTGLGRRSESPNPAARLNFSARASPRAR